MGTRDVRAMNMPRKLANVIHEMKRTSMNVLGQSEDLNIKTKN